LIQYKAAVLNAYWIIAILVPNGTIVSFLAYTAQYCSHITSLTFLFDKNRGRTIVVVLPTKAANRGLKMLRNRVNEAIASNTVIKCQA